MQCGAGETNHLDWIFEFRSIRTKLLLLRDQVDLLLDHVDVLRPRRDGRLQGFSQAAVQSLPIARQQLYISLQIEKTYN